MNEQKNYGTKTEQAVTVEVYEDEQKFIVEHVFTEHTDNDFFTIDEAQQTILQSDALGQNTQMKNRAGAESRLKFWDEFCTRVGGYGEPGQETPENWRELVPDEDKLIAVDGVFKAQIVRDKKTDKPQFLGWSRKTNTTYKIESLYDGAVIETEIELRSKSAEDVSEWNEINNSISFKAGRLMESNTEMQLPSTARAKVALIRKLIVRNDNYLGNVPAHHLLIVANDYFATKATAAKKSSSSANASVSA